jgi:DNA repair protein RadC
LPPARDLLEDLDSAGESEPERAHGSSVSTAGHRQRMRGRLLSEGPGALTDGELLEMVLFPVLPRCDTKPIAWALLAWFGILAAAIAAPVNELGGIEGMGEAAAAALKTVRAAALRAIEDRLVEERGNEVA